MDITDPDVQDELNAMANTPRASVFGASRLGVTQGKPIETRPLKPMRITTENSASIQQSSRQSSSPPPPPPVLSNVDRAAKMELEALIRKPAHTAEEKFLVLDARDKLIRLTTARIVDIKKTASTKGVCPDMCPEKERLSREAKFRVASFELKEGTKTAMNHAIAVKEYSRSSADQETPLPHELRPEPVLKLTMTYLLQNIMDLCDVSETNICDWFHFLWDRTRSIRKDITQQELCSPGTVLLVEQCARFHIHCAARLCAEEPQVFDQKINTENLTKCLQSLKYMYHDLGLKSIRCPNEAEFRAYVVLLNLHDSNFLWEVKQLRDEILHSPEIQFAIRVYLALESNNYMKFFALVRSTTYMNACILLRYFTQVRVKALQVMFKAYVPRNPVWMSLSNLTYLLAFEDFEQCTQFFEYYGLTCDRDNDRVLFDRSSFYYPDMPFVFDRAINIVEHKRHSTVGEIVHGCQLDMKDVLDKYEPHDSFDENGVLLPRAWSAEDQDYYRPEARTETRSSRSQPVSKEDVFKMPTIPTRSSPKSRLSPKTVSENNESTASSSIFGSTTSNSSNNVFKMNNKSKAESNIFSGFTQKTQQPISFGDASTSQQPNLFGGKHQPDSIDGGLFKVSNSSPFIKSAQTTNSSSIFTSNFAQKPQSTTNLFSQSTNQTPSIFGQASSNAPSLFGGFTGNSQPSNSSIFGSQNKASSVFGGSSADYTKMSGIEPLPKISFKSQPSVDETKQQEQQRKQKELEELERKMKAETEEKERQRKLEEERKERERKQLEQRKRKIENSSAELAEVIMKEFVDTNVDEIVKSEVERHRVLLQTVQNIYTELANEVINTELEKIANDVKDAWDKNILEKYFVLWRKTVRKRIERRRTIENTPQWIPNRPMNEIIPELHHPLQAQTLSLMKRYRSGLPTKLIVPPMREDSIDLWSIIGPELNKLHGRSKKLQNLYWKCVISLPDNDEDSSSRSINQWLNNVFVRQLLKHPRRNDVFFLEQNTANGQRVNVCMRTLSGARMLNESHRSHETKDIEGTNAILFFMTTKNLNGSRARLKAVLKAIQLNDAAGIIIYSFGSTHPNEVKRALRLHELIDAEKIDACVFANNGPNALCHSTKHCLKYVAANSFYDDQLEMQKTVSFLGTCLTDNLWQRIYLSMSRNPTLLEASTKLSFLIDYHNQAIEHLISMCSPNCIDTPTIFSYELRQFVPQHQLDIPLGLEYFPADWHEHVETHQKQIIDFLKSLIIEPCMELNNISDHSSMEKIILRFVRAHISSDPHAERTAYKLIQHILAYLTSTESNEFKNKFATYSWLNSFPIFTVDLLSFQHRRFVDENRLPDYVIYDKYEYQDYTKNAWWLQLNEEILKDLTVDVIRNIDVAVDEYEQNHKRQRLEETTIAEAEKIDLEETLARGYASLAKADKTMAKMNEIQSACKDISRDFSYELYENERTMRDTREFLRSFRE